MNVRSARRRPALLAAGLAALTCLVAACGAGPSTEPGAAPSIGLSTYYTGNNWRKEMVSSFQSGATDAQKTGIIGKYSVADSNGSVPQQAAQIQSMIIQGYRAILVEAASPTALNGSIQKACDAGITVVAFDSLVTADCAYKVATDYVKYGELETEYVAQRLGGKGNILMVRGIPGNSVDNDVYAGVQNVLKKYPDMKLVSEVYGQFTESVAQQQVAGVLPSLPKIDAVLTEGNDGGGAMQAFRQANVNPLPLVVMGNTGQDLQVWQKVAQQVPGYTTMSVSSYPSMSTVAMWVAVNVLAGKPVPKLVYAPVLTIPEQNRDAWAGHLGYGEVANKVLSQEDSQRFIDASASGNPLHVDSPLPEAAQ
ncbi:ABC transporter substrate-binding protein [Pseudonocardia sp. RS11V-5]|uniref:ABC transporter substrate-binding protein n=1 Tax=Pseudonocardia terrae TaxID=2905831 RepID=UPI001E47B888|nr:ABC transporter substrate-binding protein [Pseudonocardia terrae]MCE3551410.1 ABC transporter substrate-binding protein [Pseudonocardia terrae]